MVWESSHGELVDAGVDGLLSFFFFFFFVYYERRLLESDWHFSDCNSLKSNDPAQ